MLHRTIIAAILLSILIVSCGQQESKTNETEKPQEMIKTSATIPFTGEWKRSFEIGKDSIQDVLYTINEDSILYEMSGIMEVKYTMHMDTFVVKDNKWIGKLHDNYYVVFVKNDNPDSISLLKKQVQTRGEGLDMLMPSDTARSHFTSWNVYHKK